MYLSKVANTWQFQVPLPLVSTAIEVEFHGLTITLFVGWEIAGGYVLDGNIQITYGFDMTVCGDLPSL
jgi:hypothetical protein